MTNLPFDISKRVDNIGCAEYMDTATSIVDTLPGCRHNLRLAFWAFVKCVNLCVRTVPDDPCVVR